jgi:hypothetical protein
MEPDETRHYVLKGTVQLEGKLFMGGTHWTGYPSNVVKGYIAMNFHGRKILLDAPTVANYFQEDEAPAVWQQATVNRQR